ncbi:MAG TPA: hypothetical protein VM100_12910 [Longimicrobiales bacterium]|nr:hypothetical protein [Longimicrobiales bacterium]
MIRRTLFAAIAAIGAAASIASAQQVRTKGYGDASVDELIRSALLGNPRVITRDTTVSKNDTIHGNIMVVKARFILEGTIVGDLTGFGANIYVRPPARVTGQVLNVGGGFYPSELAHIGSVQDHSIAPYSITEEEGGFLVEGTTKRPAIRFAGGVQMPEYNRVDGLRAEVGPAILLPPFAGVEPTLSASIGYATARKDALGRVTLALKRGRSTLSAGWEDDITRTNEEWFRTAMKNSLTTLWDEKDYRNYYLADRTFVEFHRFIEVGQRTSQYWLRGQNEIADPLVARSVFSINSADSIRPNWLVPHSRIVSLILGARSMRTDSTLAWDLGGAFEFAGSKTTGIDNFNAFTTHSVLAFKALANHTLRIEANFRGPLPGTDELPMQRWTFVGGSGTLYTYEVAEFKGDHLAFVETEYRIPFAPRMRLPLLGRPTLRLMHNIGKAWTSTTSGRFEQNVGARLQFAFAYARIMFNPRNSDKKFSIGVSMPSAGYPWEKNTKK